MGRRYFTFWGALRASIRLGAYGVIHRGYFDFRLDFNPEALERIAQLSEDADTSTLTLNEIARSALTPSTPPSSTAPLKQPADAS